MASERQVVRVMLVATGAYAERHHSIDIPAVDKSLTNTYHVRTSYWTA